MENLFFSKLNKAKIIISMMFLLIFAAGVHLSGANVFELFIFYLFVIVFVLMPGFAIYKILNIEKHIQGLMLPIVFTFGSGFLVALYCVAIRLNFYLLLWVCPLALFAVAVFLLIKQKNTLKQKISSHLNGQFIFLLFISCFLIFVYTFAGVAKYAHPSAVGEIFLSQDFLWNVGNAESFKLGFPPQDIRFYDVRLQYHYFTELFLSALSTLSNISSYNLIAFYSQSLFLPMLVTTLYLFAKKIYDGNNFKAAIFCLSIFFFSCASLFAILPNGNSLFTNSLIKATLTNINSMTNAFVFTAVFIAALFSLFKNNFRANIGVYFLVFGSFILLTFTKSPIAAIIALGVVAAALATVLQFKFNWRGIILCLIIGISFFAIYNLNFSSGANVSTVFHYASTLELGFFAPVLNPVYPGYGRSITFLHSIWVAILMVAQSICIAPFSMPIFIKSGFVSLINFKKLSFESLLCYAVGVGGLIAFFFYHHESQSQVYFLYIALFFINLIAIKEFAFAKISKKNIINYSLLAISLITCVFLYVNLTGSGLRQYLFNYDVLLKHNYPLDTIYADDELAGEYLRSVATKDDMFATNRINSSQGLLSNVYTAFSGMQCFMEGNRYTISNMGLSQAAASERLGLNSAIFVDNTPHEEIFNICKEHGITYLVFTNRQEANIENMQYFELVFNSGEVYVFKTGI